MRISPSIIWKYSGHTPALWGQLSIARINYFCLEGNLTVWVPWTFLILCDGFESWPVQAPFVSSYKLTNRVWTVVQSIFFLPEAKFKSKLSLPWRQKLRKSSRCPGNSSWEKAVVALETIASQRQFRCDGSRNEVLCHRALGVVRDKRPKHWFCVWKSLERNPPGVSWCRGLQSVWTGEWKSR